MPYNEKKRESNRRWDRANLDRLSVAFPVGSKEAIQDAAERAGKSMNKFIVDVVLEAVKPLEETETENEEM
ncbi:DUF1778 domain-containing protein [Flavonifractor sp. An9]|uniref:DUF1778 domain-containing protein n=1 Tax=Flavonifractor sp. An9 TaxID=1965664 RepID=UPI000B39D4C5|nr:DUF1778 domain-containing protein [Flavonifractor sp. An9]OUN12141.1 hypothetical protein B5G40_05620 [Flavonifractor sp. An9]